MDAKGRTASWNKLPICLAAGEQHHKSIHQFGGRPAVGGWSAEKGRRGEADRFHKTESQQGVPVIATHQAHERPHRGQYRCAGSSVSNHQRQPNSGASEKSWVALEFRSTLQAESILQVPLALRV